MVKRCEAPSTVDERPTKVAECHGLICCGAQRMDYSQNSKTMAERVEKRG